MFCCHLVSSMYVSVVPSTVVDCLVEASCVFKYVISVGCLHQTSGSVLFASSGMIQSFSPDSNAAGCRKVQGNVIAAAHLECNHDV